MTRHNLRPEVVPLVLEVLRDSKQCVGELRNGPGCFCIDGAVCEAFRRAYPSAASWGVFGFEVKQPGGWRFRSTSAMPWPVMEWATGSSVLLQFDGRHARILNDRCVGQGRWTFVDFAHALAEGVAMP